MAYYSKWGPEITPEGLWVTSGKTEGVTTFLPFDVQQLYLSAGKLLAQVLLFSLAICCFPLGSMASSFLKSREVVNQEG